MTYFRDAYQKFLASPKNAPVAANASLLYVASSTKFEGADAIASHASRHASLVKKSDQVINAIESSDSLVLDMETTLDFVDGGGVYLPSLDDSLIATNVVTVPTLHIVHFNAQDQIQQVRIYWDQAVLLKSTGVIGKRNWPIGDAKELVRLIKSAASDKSTPPPLAPSHDSSRELPARPGSPGKRRIKDPYAADSLFDLLSPSAEAEKNGRDDPPRPSSPGKRHVKDPYAAGSLTELLSPSKEESAPVRPYAPSAAQPRPREYSDLFVDAEEEPPTPSKPSKPAKAGSALAGSNIFGTEDDEVALDRAPYRSNPKRFDHFEIGGDNTELEVKQEPKRGHPRNQSQWDFTDFTTPEKPSRPPPAEKARHFGYGDEDVDLESPPTKPHVPKPRRDAEVHFEMTEDNPDDDSGRIIASYQNRGQRLYENRLFDDNGEAMPSEKEQKQRPLSVAANTNNAGRQRNFDANWTMGAESPEPNKEALQSSKPATHAKAVQQMESQWELHDESPEPVRTATSLRDPRRHNQPSWTLGDEE